MATEYISRETVLKYVEDWSCGYDYIETETNGAINDIKAITAADVRPVVRGEWLPEIFGNKRLRCTNCNYHVFLHENFCPNCGADMREVLDNGKTT